MPKVALGVIAASVLSVLSVPGAALAGGAEVQVVPEPGSLVLLTAGLGGLAWSLRRRR